MTSPAAALKENQSRSVGSQMKPSWVTPSDRLTVIALAVSRDSFGSSGSTQSVSSEVLPNESVAVARTLVRCGVPPQAHAPYALAVVVPSTTSACEPLAENTSIVHESHDVPSTLVAVIAPTTGGRIPSLPGKPPTSRLMAPTRFP